MSNFRALYLKNGWMKCHQTSHSDCWWCCHDFNGVRHATNCMFTSLWIPLLFVLPCFEAVFLSSVCITNCMYCSSPKIANLSLEVDHTPDTMNQFNTLYSFRYIHFINCILHMVLSYTSCCNPISQRGLPPSSFVCVWYIVRHI